MSSDNTVSQEHPSICFTEQTEWTGRSRESTALRLMTASPDVHNSFLLKSEHEHVSYLLGSENVTAFHKIYLRVLKG